MNTNFGDRFSEQIARADKMAEAFQISAEAKYSEHLKTAVGVKENELYDPSDFKQSNTVELVPNGFDEQAFNRIVNLEFLDRI